MALKLPPMPKEPIGDTPSWREWFYALSQVLGSEGSAPTVSGSKGGNAALASLVSALSTAGIIKDSTS